jgi:hypothetical protein
MTIALEHIHPDDWAAVNRVTDTLRSLVIDTGGQSIGIRVGVSTGVVFTASTSSATKTVTHGLGRTPVVAFAIDNSAIAAGSGVTMSTGALTSTTFGAVGFFPSALTTTIPFYWVVIG